MGFLAVLILAIIVLVIVGGAALNLALTLVWWAIIGLVIGALARLVLPGRQAIGAIATSASGVAGSLLGGVVANAAGLGGLVQFLIAIVAAAVIVALVAGGASSAKSAS